MNTQERGHDAAEAPAKEIGKLLFQIEALTTQLNELGIHVFLYDHAPWASVRTEYEHAEVWASKVFRK